MTPEAFTGALCGLAAAFLFGVATPLAKGLLAEIGPQFLAGLLYLGAGIGLFSIRLVARTSVEARLRRADLPALLAVIFAGGVVGPVLLMWGLRRVSALPASLLLNLEAPFTVLIAVSVFREHLGSYARAAVVLILVGAAALKLPVGNSAVDVPGMIAIGGACLAWAIDNNLTQRLTLRDPFAIVRIKTLAAGAVNTILAIALGATWPRTHTVVVAMALGAVSFGASVVLDAYALRRIGAAREAAFFATAPFVGALSSLLIRGESLHTIDLAAMLLMAFGVVMLLRERHSHLHAHEPLEHEHLHVHDEHHQHQHGPEVPAEEPHTHVHRHAPIVHEHAHVPDLHHRHRHGPQDPKIRKRS